MAYENKTGLPSVTQVIRPYIDTDWFLPEHAARGTAVHGAMKAYLLGAWSPPLKAEYQPYFASGKRWVDLMVDKVIAVEKRMIHSAMGYCGKPDLVCTLKGETVSSIIDFKTSQAKANWHPLQIAAYQELSEYDSHIATHRGMTVRLLVDGSMAQADEHYGRAQVMNIFIGLLNAWKYFNK